MSSAQERGEYPGCGPDWACDSYGVGDHDYNECPDCLEQFGTYLATTASLISTGLLPLG